MKKLISGILCLAMVLSLFAGLSVSASAECAHNRLETWDNGDGTHYVFCYDCNTEWTENCVMTVIERQEPACGVDGYERWGCTCTQCGSPDAYSVTGGCGRSQLTVLASQGDDHTYTWQVETEPTEDTEGLAKLACSNCGAEPDNNTHALPALTQANVGADGYTYTVETEPSCEAPGTGVYSIALTNGDGTQEALEFSVEIPATGIHTIEWGVYQEPSEEEPGQLAYMCPGCGTAEQLGDEMPVLSNTDYYTLTEQHPATCTEQGYDVYVSNLGVFDCCPDQQFTITVQTEAAGHSFTLADNGDGTHTGTCAVCGEAVTEPHMYDDDNGNVCECGAEEALFFGFTNTEADQVKYESGLYGGINYDASGWARGGNSGAINNSGIGTLDCTTLNDGNTALWLVPSETDSATDGFGLNYHPKAGDIAEIRVKISFLTAANPTLSLRFFSEEDDSVYADEASASFVGTAGRYATVVVPMSAALDLDRISSFCLTIDAAGSGSEIGTANIDYIYIGAPSGAPSASAEGSNHVHSMGTVCSTTTGGMLSFEALELTGGTLPAGDYFLSGDMSLTSTLTLASGTVNLCLNGHVLNCGSNHIEVAGGTLNLCDCGNGGSISGTGNAAGAPINISGGTVTIYGGTVSNTATAVASGIAACNYCAINIASGTLNLKNGTLTSVIGDTVRNWETFVMDGGSVLTEGTAAAAISNSGTARLMGGSISNANGGGVWNQGTAYLLDGVTISGIYGIKNTKSTTAGTLNIYGGTITSTGDYAIQNVSSESSVNLMGAPILSAPIADIYMAAASVMNINGAITGGPYRVKVDGTPTTEAPVSFANNWTKWNPDTAVSSCFVSADAGFAVYSAADGTSLCIAPIGSHSHDMSTACGENCPINFSTGLYSLSPTMYENIIAASVAVADYIETNKRLPASVNVGTTSVKMRQFLWLACKTVVGLNAGKTTENFTIPTINSAPDQSESLTAGTLTKAQYVTACTNTLNWISSNSNTLPNYTTVGSLGKMCPNNLAYTLAKVLRYYGQNGSLPTSVSVKTWSTIANQSSSSVAAVASAEKKLAAGNYYLTTDMTLTAPVIISSGTVNLCLNGYTLNFTGGRFIVKGGTLNICDCSGGTNGKISANNTSGTGALEVTGGTVNLYSGTIRNNASSADNISNACAIKINGGKVFLRGGKVQSDIGNAINCNSGELTVDNGSTVAAGNNAISNNGTTTLNSCSLSSSGGGSAIWNQGTLTVNNGASVTGSRAIYNTCSSLNGTLNVNGGTITGTGTYAIENISANNVLNLKGAPVINSNVADFYLMGGSTITPTDKVTGGPYTILTETAPTANAPVNVVNSYSTATSIPKISSHFTSASSSYTVVRKGSYLALALSTDHCHDMDQACGKNGPCDYLATLPTTGTVAGGYYYLSGNTTLTGNLTISSSVNICLNGKTLNCGSNHIEIADGGSLYICDCGTTGKITGTVGANNSTGYGVIRVNGGTDEQSKGAKLQIYGGTVVNTGTTAAAGTEQAIRAINVINGNAFIYGDSIISSENGIAILVANTDAVLSVKDNASISAQYRAIASFGTVNMTGGTVNSANVGIYAAAGALSISAGSVTGTYSGIVIKEEAKTEISGGTVSGTYAIAASGSPMLGGAAVLNGSAADVLLSGSAKLGFTDALTAPDTAITLATETAPTVDNDILLTDCLAKAISVENWQSFIASADSTYAIRIVDGEAYLHLHIPVTGQSIDATCTSEGMTGATVCSTCNEVLVAGETIPAIGHSIVTVSAEDATCTTNGHTAYTYCENCDEIIDAPETIPALGHDSTYEVITPATCTDAGSGIYTCSRCGDVYTDIIPALGHEAAPAVEENRVEPSCVASGSYDTVIYCAVCGTELSRQTVTIPALGNAHIPGSGVIENNVPPTCTSAGSYDAVIYCTVCSQVIYRVTVPVPASGEHTAASAVEENVIEATCTAAGSYDSVIYCKDCGIELHRETIETPIAAHTPGAAAQENAVPATCTVDGSYDSVIRCEICGAELSREEITVPASGHSYTYSDNGDGTHTVGCANCGYSAIEAHTFTGDTCVCGAKKVSFGIISASLRLHRNIDIIFTVSVPDGAQNIKLTVETDHGMVNLTDYEEDGSNLRFVYADLNPQQIGDLLTATLSAKIDGKTKYDTLDDYSIRQYCVNILNNPSYSGDAKLHTLLADLLAYGAAAQRYVGYATDKPVTDGISEAPSTFAPISGKTVSFNGTADAATDWTSAGLVLSDSVTMRLTFRAAATNNLTVKVRINDREESFTAFETDANGRFYVDFSGINATEFDDTVSATFYRNGTAIGRTVNYSVNTYICSTQNSTNANLQALVRALYNYGVSAKAYSTAE